ncbi:helix-turn-helix transcriptional regulator [Mesobacillus subterraneus]|uniref:helix-turn-helix domain-containing protein n=1 Tax=Mesobacillus subterraneus TaxID=285983 RepID=UPI00203C5868|nr:helix-turn-helix transcriptional regulator [Mesobacillus subterraneus]MCM3574721.1 helix-turn-helix transcriptional regulator [Mesobacillus subterraneus]
MDDILSYIGKKVRAYRKEKNYTQEVLASKSGSTITYLSMVEKGEANITIMKLESICTALGIHITQVLPKSPLNEIKNNEDSILEILKEHYSDKEVREIYQLLLTLILKIQKKQ